MNLDPPPQPGGFFLSAIGTLQAVDRHNNVWTFKDLHQPFKDASHNPLKTIGSYAVVL
jgi:hypothetical protein